MAGPGRVVELVGMAGVVELVGMAGVVGLVGLVELARPVRPSYHHEQRSCGDKCYPQ